MTDRAPWMRRVRRQPSPRLEIRPTYLSLCHPARTESVKRRDDLLRHRLYGDRSDAVGAAGLENPLRVGAVGLVALDVGTDLMRWKQCHLVPQTLDAPSPEVSRSASLHHHGRRRLLSEEGQELCSRKALSASHPSRSIGHRDFTHSLCQVYGNARIVLHGGLLLAITQRRLWHIDAD